MTPYQGKLQDPRWQRKRLEIFGRTDFKCERCGEASRTMHVHHMRYVKGREPWEYDWPDLRALCDECHRVVEVWRLELPALLAQLSFPQYAAEVGLLRMRAAVNSQLEFVALDDPDIVRGAAFWLRTSPRLVASLAAESTIVHVQDLLCIAGLRKRPRAG